MSAMPPDATITGLRTLCEHLASSTAELVRAQTPTTVEVAATKSNDLDVVTRADRAAEDYLRSEIARWRPQDAILGEEGGASDGSSGLTWVVDPIDGTVNYLYGLGSCSVSVAVVLGAADPVRWQLLAAAVCEIPTGTTWSAARGRGATRDGTPVRVREATDLRHALVATGFHYDDALRAGQGRSVGELLAHVRDVRRFGSAALDLCRVADGRVDAYYEEGLSPWDHAAGTLLVEEAGGVVHGAGGGAPGRGLVVAGPAGTLDVLEPLLARLGAGRRPGITPGFPPAV
ncbi:inositol monophosphatase [Flavimobilis sp. GY10621]|uniref:Inositol-1-monophosphatase n=1 Tax=Flavimobilis rhizosphaerae TaxID=2775421 RepID=A0ABR9DT33_9MICO|nr:inositol monophosphatase family protein [Flavimobilis rhizosphaerae]MBD9700290.1 inositol monophosphatase [Flavimobilis rhizosphaerae]